jgi:hypothetical protein
MTHDVWKTMPAELFAGHAHSRRLKAIGNGQVPVAAAIAWFSLLMRHDGAKKG